jgi:hypothetical protein
VLDRRREQEDERSEARAPTPAPAPPLRFGTLPWASAVGNQAVARLARQSAGEELPVEAVVDAELTSEPEAAVDEPALEDLPEELPE